MSRPFQSIHFQIDDSKSIRSIVCLSLLSVAKGQEQPLRIIDVHTHTSFSGEVEKGRNIKQTEAQYFQEWAEAGVVGAVAHTTTTGANFYNLKSRNVIYCAGVGPETKIAEVESGLKSGKYGWMFEGISWLRSSVCVRCDVRTVLHAG